MLILDGALLNVLVALDSSLGHIASPSVAY